MLFVPLPFVVALLLILLFVGVVRRDEGRTANRSFRLIILVSIVQSVLSGLRWGYDVTEVMYVAPLGAALVPPLAYTGVAALVYKTDSRLSPRRLAVHAGPALAVTLLLLTTFRGAIDLALIAIFVGYAIAILLLMRPGADALRLAPFEAVAPTYRAILFAACTLLFSAAIDLFVFLDFAWTQGEHARPVIAIGNLAGLVILSIAAASASPPGRAEEQAEAPEATDLPDDKKTIAAIEALMATRHVYRDVELDLDRLARKLCMPTRQISTAVNRTTGKNVSQYVNEFRIAEACSLLATTDKPVTEIMFEVGFQTKSNFNREFRRVTEMSPLQWRGKQRPMDQIVIEHDL
ncbi:helix-turn-helix domain-containing protein [Oryzibacter oryziterrae]|uniref:helix-turn-helix domain-containing protein n=1 Tax=Oryzibacter oryziterrae TaxID=2766474 RepID=UPI001F330BFE|nr:AraC family transcriptional regulator [Oryzibacter oryziterrae]